VAGERRNQRTPPRGTPTLASPSQPSPPSGPFHPTSAPPASLPGHRTLVTSATFHDPAPLASQQIRGPDRVRNPSPGDVISSGRGSYQIRQEVGRGAHGAVYEAVGPFDQRFALKLQVPAMRPYAEVYEQWRSEAHRLLLLRHPNVVYLHDAFEHSYLFYMALEWCPRTLKDLLVRALPVDLAIELMRQLLAATQYLHDNDIVHGDIHAGNVLLTELERPVTKLADFGISQELQGKGFARPNIVHHAIMAPEVVATGYTSRQSDLYQIGLLFFWMITGHPALDYAVPYTELVRQVTEGTPRARAEALNTPLGHIIAKMLRRREAYRYASAHEVWQDLRNIRDDLPH
jgi:serine/threonine protein kinase